MDALSCLRKKTRLQIRVDTELKNFPLYCTKCKQESLIDAKNFQKLICIFPCFCGSVNKFVFLK